MTGLFSLTALKFETKTDFHIATFNAHSGNVLFFRKHLLKSYYDLTYLFTMYLFKNSNFNFSLVFSYIEIQNYLFPVKAVV